MKFVHSFNFKEFNHPSTYYTLFTIERYCTSYLTNILSHLAGRRAYLTLTLCIHITESTLVDLSWRLAFLLGECTKICLWGFVTLDLLIVAVQVKSLYQDLDDLSSSIHSTLRPYSRRTKYPESANLPLLDRVCL